MSHLILLGQGLGVITGHATASSSIQPKKQAKKISPAQWTRDTKLESSPQRRLASVFDLDKSRGESRPRFKVSGYAPGLLPPIHHDSHIQKA